MPLYKGEMLYSEMITLLSQKGYTLMSLEPGYYDPSMGQLLQVDGIFFPHGERAISSITRYGGLLWNY